ncbi:uncharacterized protein LOC119067043 [Bradysia coprophila]|uniref:uncharacterized protein LOC119067043 n=1 Tax=Bradysia coprophila TaxID=38358 RepID=UPI00187D706C|nr:uncharacterized protein LOC119067043 [Bradysia coprophila]
MGDIDENTPPIYVLLPTCLETDTDVFLEILKSVVLHTRLHDNFHIHSIISGMDGEVFEVDVDDLTTDWKNLTSHSRKVRQSKLLGYWAARNYPLIGKKLIGAAWQPSNTCNVQVSEPMEIAKDRIDEIVAKKLQIRIIELNVCRGTSKKLNYFVRAPIGLNGGNVVALSSKMKAFDIKSEFVAECWNALKVGVFPSNIMQQMDAAIRTSHMPVERHRIIRENGDQSSAEVTNSRSSLHVSGMPPCNVVLTEITSSASSINVAGKPKAIPSAKRKRCVTPNGSKSAFIHDKTNMDVLRGEVCEMRKDIQNLTKCVRLNGIGNENDSERFHLVVFKQKDSEISELKSSIVKLEKEKDQYEHEQRNLNGEIAAKSDLVSALEKALDSSSKLHGKMEEESNTLIQNLSASNQRNCELRDTNEKLHEELKCARIHSANMESNLKDLLLKISAAEKINAEMAETNEKLKENLNTANDHFTNMEQHLQCQIHDLLQKSSAAVQTNIELTDKNRNLQDELVKVKIELKKNEKLSENLDDLRTRSNTLIGEFKDRIEESDKLNVALDSQNKKLQEELRSFRQDAGKDKTNRPETYIQTDRKDAHDGYDEGVLRKQNMDCNEAEDMDCNEAEDDSFEKNPPESVESGNNACSWDEVFVSDNPVVQTCRPVLQKQRFGWMKFQQFKNAKFCPAFVYPTDDDGLERAQKIKADGYITDKKSPFWEFHLAWELPDAKKDSANSIALKKFNKTFGAYFK